MEEMKNQDSLNAENESQEELELNHTDKLVGIFTEPSRIFSQMSNYPPKHLDWVIPIFLMIIIAVAANVVMMSNPQIRYSVMEKQMERMEKNFQDAVDSGRMSQEQADTQLETMRDAMENNMAAGRIFQTIGIFIYTFITLFVVSLIFWLMSKFALKGEGTYAHALVAYGMPYYITIIQIIVMVILALTMNKFFQGTSVGTRMEADTSTFAGFLLTKVDVFSIWFYAVVGIALAKMFKSNQTGKYLAMVFGLWLGFSILFFFVSKAVPFLQFFGA